MSTIKSSDEHLTLNADGSSKDIKFQANGVEVGSLSSSGVMTATTFTGAATDTTKLPLAGGTMTGVLINKAPSSGSTTLQTFQRSDAAVAGEVKYDDTASTRGLQIGTTTQHDLALKTHNTNRLQITYDGRGLSQFTAQSWVRVNMNGGHSTVDSHNISSISDGGTGVCTVNIATDPANANYGVVAAPYDTSNGSESVSSIGTGTFTVKVSLVISSGVSFYDRGFTAVVFGD